MKKIAPSILSADGSRLAEEIRAVEAAGADWIHVDVMDGHFVPNLTLGPAMVAAIRKVTTLPLDVHLMIEAPERFIPEFARAGSDWITVHVEAAHHLHRTVGLIHEAGCRAGVSLNPATPLVQVEEILPDLDLLLVMSVNPGFGGQRFIDGALSRIRRAKEMIAATAPRVLLEVDGGVTVDNIGAIAQAGADVLVAGAAIFGSPDYAGTIAAMKARVA
jgi:ribulose-phosphate 3-epimerase